MLASVSARMALGTLSGSTVISTTTVVTLVGEIYVFSTRPTFIPWYLTAAPWFRPPTDMSSNSTM